MRKLFVAAVMILTVSALRADTPGGKQAEVKGPHLCCAQCEKAALATLAKVDGISEVKCDRPNKTVSFTAKDTDAAKKAWDALYEAGFAGTLTVDGKTTGKKVGSSSDKVNEVTFDKVHACCGQCVKALNALFPDAKVTVTGKGAQRTVTIAGKDLNPSTVLNTLNNSGFNGVQAEAKKE
jgi:hypothetical protein